MYDAVAFSWAGDKYLGTPYSEMDCQKFVEKCMSDVGFNKDLGGSNAWYRECIRAGWVGSPEDCKKKFGSIPKGALLFILEPVSDRTPAKYRNDGVGDATHMGIVTHRNKGAIHSSYTNQCVCTSKFNDKTIPNYGWNRIGLLLVFDYGLTINNYLLWYTSDDVPSDPDQKEDKKGESSVKMIVNCPENETVFLRQSWNPSSSMYGVWDRIKPGTKVEVLDNHCEDWLKVRVNGKVGWMMSKFLVNDDSDIPSEDPDEMIPVDPDPDSDDDTPEEVRIKLSASEASTLFVLLKDMIEQIDKQIGRG